MRATADPRRTMPQHMAVDRALQVLSFLGSRSRGASLQEISGETGIPKASLHRMLRAMRARGYAAQAEPGGTYLLGPAALEAAFRFHGGLDLRRLLHPLASRVSDHFQQTCHVATLDGAHVVYIDKLEADIGMRLTSVIGGRNPAHATGVGKALLADALPDPTAVHDWVRQYGPLQARTAHTVTSAGMLANALADVRSLGWALDDEESEDGLVCVAARAPLVFGSMQPSVAISVSGLRTLMVRYGIEQIGSELLAIIDDFEFTANGGANHMSADAS